MDLIFPVCLVWFRNDLRIHDHAPLRQAVMRGGSVLPVYCFDPRQFEEIPRLKLPKTGPYRANFLLESLSDLRQTLREHGSDLILLRGKPEEVIPKFCARHQVSEVLYHEEATRDELTVEERLDAALRAQGVTTRTFWGSTLIAPSDLPFAPKAMPNVFSDFHGQVIRACQIPSPQPEPERLPPIPDEIPRGELPQLADLGLKTPERDPRQAFVFRGGERAGQSRLQDYLEDTQAIRHYKETRNGLSGPYDSSKLSAWMAHGCLSPRLINQRLSEHEARHGANDSTAHFRYELFWRDYFRFLFLKSGNQLFLRNGLRGDGAAASRMPEKALPCDPAEAFSKWCLGRTGFPFVDANLCELNQTGYLSNRGRQNVASFLAKSLGADWRLGASYFEALLLDYDPCSNWGNWAYLAGVGTDPRNRVFNVLRQAHQYDPEGHYVRIWLPELAALPGPLIHEPFSQPVQTDASLRTVVANVYPAPILSPERFCTAQ